MKLALIGVANSGRTTLLNALAGLALETQPYPNTEGEPHRAVVKAPDARVDELARIYKAAHITTRQTDHPCGQVNNYERTGYEGESVRL